MSAETRLNETIADIAYQAGVANFYTDDSRADIHTFIGWAEEFEKARQCDEAGVESYFGEEYMTAIEEFTMAKLQAAMQDPRYPADL